MQWRRSSRYPHDSDIYVISINHRFVINITKSQLLSVCPLLRYWNVESNSAPLIVFG